jgi:hypothetical protein
MGAVSAIWNDRLADHLVAALEGSSTGDIRRTLGKQRGYRTLAGDVAERVARGAV